MILSKGFYKGISLFIKVGILLLSLSYIYFKLNKNDLNRFSGVITAEKNITLLLICFILMLFNWSIEAIKWKKLISPLEQITFSGSLKAVFAGVTVSIFTPNRVGEFAGKIFYLKQADKIKATLLSFVGSGTQLVITVIAGIAGLVFSIHLNFHFSSSLSSAKILTIGIIVLIAATLSFIFLQKQKNIHFLDKLTQALLEVDLKKLTFIFSLSAIRYIIFSLQYYLVLLIFGLSIDPSTAFPLIAMVFFVSSAIPTFALTEITVRGASAMYFFSFVTTDTTAILSSSLLLWLINIAIPSIIGGIFVWDLHFFKD